VTGEKETGAEPLCKITVMENGKKVVLNCFTEEEKKETFEEIKLRKLPIVDVKNKMASGSSMATGGDVRFGTCKTCKWWNEGRATKNIIAECDFGNTITGGKFEKTEKAFYVTADASDDSGLHYELMTGEDFGCIHHTVLDNKNKMAKGGNISSMTILEDTPVNINFSKGTFSEEGLSKEQVRFLKHMESLWLEDKLNQKTRITELEKYKNSGRGEEILEALNYWDSLNKPLDKKSAFHPSYLSDYLVGGGKFHLQINVGGEFNSRNVGIAPKLESILKETTLLYPLAPKSYYFKISQRGDLYIVYQQIIGDRMIASNVITDFEKGGDTSPKTRNDINWLITG
jgi:hypothetical protein